MALTFALNRSKRQVYKVFYALQELLNLCDRGRAVAIASPFGLNEKQSLLRDVVVNEVDSIVIGTIGNSKAHLRSRRAGKRYDRKGSEGTTQKVVRTWPSSRAVRR